MPKKKRPVRKSVEKSNQQKRKSVSKKRTLKATRKSTAKKTAKRKKGTAPHYMKVSKIRAACAIVKQRLKSKATMISKVASLLRSGPKKLLSAIKNVYHKKARTNLLSNKRQSCAVRKFRVATRKKYEAALTREKLMAKRDI